MHNFFTPPDKFTEGKFLKRSCEMPLSCEDYRYQQQLLALKRRLAEDETDSEEREEMERLVQELERKLKMSPGI